MSKNIESYALIQAMREDLMECYREVAPNCLNQEGAWRRTIKHPAKRYYVTPKQALQRASKYLRGDHSEINAMKRQRRRMWVSLMGVIKEVADMPENVGKPLLHICRIAVERPAPEFFLTKYSIKNTFIAVKYNRYDSDGRTIKDFERRTKRRTRDYHNNGK